jgi:hypothetical protein
LLEDRAKYALGFFQLFTNSGWIIGKRLKNIRCYAYKSMVLLRLTLSSFRQVDITKLLFKNFGFQRGADVGVVPAPERVVLKPLTTPLHAL